MSRRLFLALALPLLAVEVVAQFFLRDRQLTDLFAVLALGVIAVRWVLGPQAADETESDPDDTSEGGKWDAPGRRLALLAHRPRPQVPRHPRRLPALRPRLHLPHLHAPLTWPPRHVPKGHEVNRFRKAAWGLPIALTAVAVVWVVDAIGGVLAHQAAPPFAYSVAVLYDAVWPYALGQETDHLRQGSNTRLPKVIGWVFLPLTVAVLAVNGLFAGDVPPSSAR
ncbi:hypothetical protein ACWDZX_17095 [Streptomyces collinus]